jgi:hypothetical protein
MPPQSQLIVTLNQSFGKEEIPYAEPANCPVTAQLNQYHLTCL